LIKKGINVEIISIVWTFIEAVVAISAGILAHSLALAVFGVDSVIELIASFVLLWRLFIEMKGQSIERVLKTEKIASWVVGIALILLSVYIIISVIYNLINHNMAEASPLGIVLAIIAGIIMPMIALSKRKIGDAIGSRSLKADGYCSMVCAYMAWVLLIGVVFTALFKWWWIDSIISLAFVYFVVKEGIEAIQEAQGKHCDCDCENEEK
jgi:divalent metal cation (Fe/Co/Zn/Cd) transporter